MYESRMKRLREFATKNGYGIKSINTIAKGEMVEFSRGSKTVEMKLDSMNGISISVIENHVKSKLG